MNLPQDVIVTESRLIAFMRAWRGPVLGVALVLASASFLWVSLLTLHNSDATEAVRRSGDQAACRAEQRVPVDRALADLSTAQADLLSIATEAQAAQYTGRPGDMTTAVASMPVARANLRAASDNVVSAIADYRTAFDECHP